MTETKKPMSREIAAYLGNRESELELITWIQNSLKHAEFQKYYGLERCNTCENCTRKQPCLPMNHNDIFALFKKQDGMCSSCKIKLSLFDFDAPEEEVVSIGP